MNTETALVKGIIQRTPNLMRAARRKAMDKRFVYGNMKDRRHARRRRRTTAFRQPGGIRRAT